MEDSSNAIAPTAVSKTSPGKSFYRRLKALSPFPFLAKARNFYVRSLSACAGSANFPGLAAGGPGITMTTSLPKSFSTTSSSRSEEEYGELVRAASMRNSPGFSRSFPAPLKQPFPRSMSAAPPVGTIDEDSPAFFPGSFRKSVSVAESQHPQGLTTIIARRSHLKTEIVDCT